MFIWWYAILVKKAVFNGFENIASKAVYLAFEFLMPHLKRLSFATIVIFLVLSVCAQDAELSKKQLKTIRKELRTLSENGEYIRVVNNIYLLRQHSIDLKADEIDMWLSACYQADDYHEAMKCLFYCDSAFKIQSKLQKKVDELSRQRIDALEKSRVTHNKYAEMDTAYILHLSLEKTNELVEALPEFSYWKIVRADVYARQGRLNTALEVYNKYREKYQIYPQFNRQLAGVYFDLSKFDSSLQYLKLLEPELMGDPQYQLMRAYCHLELFEFAEALEYYKKIEENGELNRVALINKFFCADMVGDSVELLTSRIQLMRLDSNDMSFINETSELSETLYGSAKSREIADSLVQEAPENTNYRMFRIQHYDPKASADFEPMLRDVQFWSEHDTENILPHLWVAWFILEGERNTERRAIARDALQKAYALDSFDLRIYEYGCKIHMWPEREVAREYKTKGIKNMKIYYKEIQNNAFGAYQVAQIYSYADNGYYNKRSYRDSLLAYLNLSLELGMDSFTVLQERHNMYDKDSYDRAIADKWWLIKHMDSTWYQRNLYWGIVNLYEMQDRYKEAKELILYIRDHYGDDRTLQWRLRSVNRELRKQQR